MNFKKLVEVYEELENTSSGNKMREVLAEFFKKVPNEDIAMVAYLTLGQIGSDYEKDNVLGMAEKSVLKAITTAGAVESSKVKKLMTETGDVGSVAEQIMKNKPFTLIPVGNLTVHEVFEKLHKITSTSGSGSQDIKTNLLASMLQKTNGKGAKHLTRIALGTLRMGVGDMTILDALSIAYTSEKKNKKILERVYNICPDVGEIAETLAKKGLESVEKINLKLGRPFKVMLAQRIKELEELPEKIPAPWTVEGKYDGERVQAHKNKKGEITLFSRRLDDTTSQFPDLVKHLQKHIDAETFIIEGEIIAIDKKRKPLPFQTLMQRRRKHDVASYAKKVPINLKPFDLVYLNGESLMEKSYRERSEILEKIIKTDDVVVHTDKIVTSDLKEVDKFFHKMLKTGYEGIIIKSRADDSVYQAGTRGWNWIKWKKEYVKEMVDTFDLVIVGAFAGRGKRGSGYGALLCATYNHKNDTFETLCKLGTGLTDEVLEELPKMLKKYEVKKKPARLTIKKEMIPDFWFEPNLVLEVFGAEITKSPYHTCSSGLALRFPRFLKFRENKKAEQATYSEEIKGLFEE